jgi:hypothetical protein
MPVTTPVLLTVAVPGHAILHVPPAGVQLIVVVPVSQTESGPVITDGKPITDTTVDTRQPDGLVYVIVDVNVPDCPVTIPLAPTVATAVLPLSHVPPLGVLLRVVVWPTQMVGLPAMGVGAVLTVPVTVRLQPDANVYIIDTVPAAIPQYAPVDAPMVADEPTTDHVPPAGFPDSVLQDPSHT